jgi:hypothetical protein
LKYIYGYASAGGTRFGLENDGGIVTGSSVGSPDEDCDTIIGSGQNTIGGLLNRGVILTGIGNDQILAYTKVTIMSGGDGPVNAGLLSGIGTTAILNSKGSIDTGNDNDTIAGSAYGWGHVIYNESGSIVTGSGGDTITGYASGSGRIGIYNSGSVNTVNGGTNSDVDTIAGTANGNSSKGIANYGNINNDYSRLPSSVNKVQITGQSNGISSVGLYNRGNIATGNEKDIISGIATGTSSVGILNDGFDAQRPQPEWIYASIGSVANEASKIIGKATGTGTTGILNRGLIYLGVDVLTGLSSPKSASITGSSSGGVGSYGIKNDSYSSIYTGAGSDFITGTTAGVGGIGIYNDGLISTGAGNDTISTRLGNKYSDFGGSNTAKGSFDLGSGNDTVDGFGRGIFNGGDDSDTIKLPKLQTGQFYTVDYSSGMGGIKRSTDNVIMGFADFETLLAPDSNSPSIDLTGTSLSTIIKYS